MSSPISVKRSLLEFVIRGLSWAAPSHSNLPENPRSIFVLRNNDLGDLLVATPLFEALRRRFPHAHLVAGIGPWSEPILENNPHVDEVLALRAPWHNKYIPRQGWGHILRYVFLGKEAASLAARRFDIGLDILGSPAGSLLFMRAAIPFRIGVRGYAGGHSSTQLHIGFNPSEHVGDAALRMAELLGATSLPANKPQIFLSATEIKRAEETWQEHWPSNSLGGRRLVLASGAGLPQKQWPQTKWEGLVQQLASEEGWQIALVGAAADRLLANSLAALHPAAVNLTSHLSLRETLALVSRADAVVCHSSMILHAAAAWEIPTLVLLGPMFGSPAQHALQWGHPRTVMLGEATPAQAIAALKELCSSVTHRTDALDFSDQSVTTANAALSVRPR